jgi:hypothetical protein
MFLLGMAVTASLPGATASSEDDQRPRPTVHNFQMTLRASQPEFAQLSPVEITVDGLNRDDSVYQFSAKPDPFDRFEIRVYQNKEPVSMTRFGQIREHWENFRVAGSAYLEIRPGERFEYSFYPNLVYDMTRPGEYTISVSLPCVNRKTGHPDVRLAEPIKVKVTELPLGHSGPRTPAGPRINPGPRIIPGRQTTP